MFKKLLILSIFVYTLLHVVPVEGTCKRVTKQVSKQQDAKLELSDLNSLRPSNKPFRLNVTHDTTTIIMGMAGSMEVMPKLKTKFEIMNQSKEHITFKILNVTKNDAGIYNFSARGDLFGCVRLVTTDKPRIILFPEQPVLQLVNGTLFGKINLTCNARSTTKPTNHNLPMIYRWFKHGIYYGNGRILQDRVVNITDIGDDIICIATDDPDCKTSLQDTKSETVTFDTECKDVVGISEKFIIQPLYGPYDTTLTYRSTTLKPGYEIQKRIGEELSVNCMSDCNPACNISWYKDGKMLSYNSQLHLPDLQESDDGVYTCTVNNTHGTRNISFNLSTKAKKTIQPLNKTPTTMTTTTTTAVMEEDNLHQPANEGNQPFIIILGLSIGVVMLVIIVSVLIVVFICMKIRNVPGGYTKSKKRRKKKKSSAQKVYPGWRTNENRRDDDERLFEAIELHRGAALADTKRNFANFKLREAHNNIEELIYADLDLPLCNNNIIHGQKYKIIYGVIDFNKVPPPRPCGYVSEEDSSSSSSS